MHRLHAGEVALHGDIDRRPHATQLVSILH
jgi:hypothetical protein